MRRSPRSFVRSEPRAPIEKRLGLRAYAQIAPVKQSVVHVNVGDKGIKENFDVAERYGNPLEKGVPALMRPES